MQDYVFEATGTKWVITMPNGSGAFDLNDIRDRIEQFEVVYSRFRPNSFISRASRNPDIYQLPPDAKELFDTYHTFYKLTNGRFTPLIGSTLVQAGYDNAYTFKSTKLTDVPDWDAVLEYNYPNLTIKKKTQLDFGAAGKGYIIDIVARLLLEKGFYEFIVDAGGDIYQHSADKPIQVGLEHPLDSTKVVGVATVQNQAICASSGNRRKWGEFHHIINPETKASSKEILATWVIADKTIIADAAATSLFFVDPAVFKGFYNFEYLIIYSNMKITKSKNFNGELFNA